MEQFLAQLPLFLLVASRMGGVIITSPVFNNRFIPPQLRAALAFILALLVLPRASASPGMTEGSTLILAAMLELLTGMVIGFLTQLILAVMAMAGSLVDIDMGFTIAQILDPVTGRAEPLLGTFFQSLTLVVYLMLNAHHWLIRALAESYSAVPAGGLSLGTTAPIYIVAMFGSLLSLAVQIVLPFTAVMLLTTVALAGINRAVAQLNIFALGLGTKALVGLVLLFLIFPYLLPRMEWLFSAGYAEMIKTLDLMRP
jgi:flagellar biosynthetic protein FliR